MSKSKGNVVWADELMDKYSVDILRYWVGTASIGSDLPFNEQDLIAGKRFLTKLWNASRFVFMNLEGYKGETPEKLEKIDKYMLEKTKQIVEKTKKHYSEYDIAGAKRIIEDFFWHMFADNYLEIVKKRIYNETGNRKLSAQYTLYKSLLAIIKLIAPIMPFITEEIYQNYYKKTEKTKSIHLTEFEKIDIKEKTEPGDLFLEILSKIRQEKTNNKKPMNAEINLSIDKKDYDKISEMIEDLKDVSGAQLIETGKFKVEFV